MRRVEELGDAHDLITFAELDREYKKDEGECFRKSRGFSRHEAETEAAFWKKRRTASLSLRAESAMRPLGAGGVEIIFDAAEDSSESCSPSRWVDLPEYMPEPGTVEEPEYRPRQHALRGLKDQ